MNNAPSLVISSHGMEKYSKKGQGELLHVFIVCMEKGTFDIPQLKFQAIMDTHVSSNHEYTCLGISKTSFNPPPIT
jgi:hypothetical protein